MALEKKRETYEELVLHIRQTLVEGQRKIEQLKVETYWRMGKLIQGHLKRHEKRAGYGDRLLERLGKDLGVSERLLRRTVQFYRQFPEIRSTWTELTWSHYRTLLTVPDAKVRARLTQQTLKQEWTVRQLQEKVLDVVRADADTNTTDEEEDFEEAPAPESLLPSDLEERFPASYLKGRFGKLYHYRILAPGSEHTADTLVVIDLGFQVSRNLDAVAGRGLKPGDFVASRKTEAGAYKAARVTATAKDIFTYQAFVEKVVDGDTLRVKIDLGFDTWVRQYLRLRGVNAPELTTAEGRAARDYVKARLAPLPFIWLTSTRADKYDRYLADVWLPADAANENEKIFLNQELLRQGLARPV